MIVGIIGGVGAGKSTVTRMLVELGEGQSEAVLALARPLGWQLMGAYADLAGIERCLVLRQTLAPPSH